MTYKNRKTKMKRIQKQTHIYNLIIWFMKKMMTLEGKDDLSNKWYWIAGCLFQNNNKTMGLYPSHTGNIQ